MRAVAGPGLGATDDEDRVVSDTAERRFINPPDAWDTTRYGFSQAVVSGPGETIYVSGQTDWDVDMKIGHDDLGGQTRGSLENIARVLAAAGASFDDVTILRLYIVADPKDDLSAVSEALRSTFAPGRGPATTWIMVRGLADPDFLIEIEATAVRR